MACRSARLDAALLACSTTPRTTRLRAETGGARDAEQLVYDEAKLALCDGEVPAARALLALLPSEYRNAGAYLAQCDAYEALCRQGVVSRRAALPLRRRLAGIFGEPVASHAVARYADALCRDGYGEAAVAGCTLRDVDSLVAAARMRDGHRALLVAHAAANTHVALRAWLRLTEAARACAPLVAAWRRAADEAPAS